MPMSPLFLCVPGTFPGRRLSRVSASPGTRLTDGLVQLRRGARTSQEAEPATLGLMTPKREQTHTKTPTHARSWPSVALRAFSVATSCGR